jgi:hypothetical protein
MLGIRLVFVLPTVFFLVSQILKYALKTQSRKEVATSAANVASPIFSWMGQRADRQFRWEFSIDSAILSMANGLILVFELQRVTYGIALLILGVILSLAGFVAIESKSEPGWTIVSLMLYLLFFSEMFYFAVFGFSFSLLGITVLPWEVFLVPSLACLAIIIIALVTARKSRPLGRK